MKKVRTFMALLLSLTFVTPAFACKDKDEALSPDEPPSITDSTEEGAEGENDSEEESETPTPEQPETPESSEAPETPETPQTPTPPVSTPTIPSTPSTPTVPETPVINTKAQYIKCTGDNVNIRSGAGTSYSVLGSAEEGTMYAVIGKTGNWYKTYYRNQTAYVYASYAAVFTLEKAKSESVEDVVSEGYKLLGVPYVYGAVRLHDGKGKLLSGFSVQKFDCSSLIQYIFYKGAGKLLNVNTRTQVKQGKYVHPDDLQRGDCIFFTNEQRQYNTGIERIGHVALYLGNNYILHTSSDYARIEKISAQRWKFYVEARRFI